MQSKSVIPVRVSDMQVILKEQVNPRYQDLWVAYSFDNDNQTSSNFFYPTANYIQIESQFVPVMMVLLSDANDSTSTPDDQGTYALWGIGLEDETNFNKIVWRVFTPYNVINSDIGVRSVTRGTTSNYANTSSALASARGSRSHQFVFPRILVPNGLAFFVRLFHPSSVTNQHFHITLFLREKTNVA